MTSKSWWDPTGNNRYLPIQSNKRRVNVPYLCELSWQVIQRMLWGAHVRLAAGERTAVGSHYMATFDFAIVYKCVIALQLEYLQRCLEWVISFKLCYLVAHAMHCVSHSWFNMICRRRMLDSPLSFVDINFVHYFHTELSKCRGLQDVHFVASPDSAWGLGGGFVITASSDLVSNIFISKLKMWRWKANRCRM